MGKGTIQNHLGNGQYSVTINFDNSGIDDQVSRLQTVISELDSRITVRLADEQAAAAEMDSAWQDLQDAIGVLAGIDQQEDPASWQDQADTVTGLQEIYHQAYVIWSQAHAARRELEADRASKQQRITLLESNRQDDETVNAWCADYTTDLSGEVGLVEIPGERQYVQIRPGYNGAADYEAARDGAIVPIMATTPAATFYNLAMMPGWQKWRPGYRTGIISNIDYDNDICDVALDDQASSIMQLNVNANNVLSNVPIEYMTCNVAAFDSDDRVLVEFSNRDRTAAKVIGFADNPKKCGLGDIGTGVFHSLGSQLDGTALSTTITDAPDSYDQGQTDVNNWSGIIQVSGGWYHSLGLTSSGAVVTAGPGDKNYGQVDIAGTGNIVQISAGDFHSLGLTSSGAVVATGDRYGDGPDEVESWSNIIAVAAGGQHSLGLRSNGTVVAAGNNDEGQCDVSWWADIVAIAAGYWHSIGVYSNGAAVGVGRNLDAGGDDAGQIDVGGWSNIIAVAAGHYHTIGLRSDGTVVATGDNARGQCNVGSWVNVVKIAAAGTHSIALHSDGSVSAVGWCSWGECDVGGWNLS